MYFDLFSIALVRYRARWVLPLALAGFVALAVAVAAGVKRRVVRLRVVAREVGASRSRRGGGPCCGALDAAAYTFL